MVHGADLEFVDGKRVFLGSFLRHDLELAEVVHAEEIVQGVCS
jgi:hypothetical protein